VPAAGITAAPNAVFTAPVGTINGVSANTLQTGDVLNGSGQQNVLNATLVGGAAIIPTINNIPTVNLTVLAENPLNLGTSTGVTTIGDVNSVANVAITGAKTALTALNKSAGISRNTEVIFQNNVLTGPANAVAINLDGVDGGNIRLEASTPSSTNGYETFNVNAVSASSIGRLISGGSLDNIIVTGANLSIRGTAGLDALEPSLLRFNAAAQTGSLVVGRIDNGNGLTQGASVVNAGVEDLNFVGSNNGTTLIVQGTSLGNNDNLAGGSGTNDTLVLTGGSTAIGGVGILGPNTAVFTASGFENLVLTDTDGRGVSALSNYDLANVTGVNQIVLGTKSNRVSALGNYNYNGPLAINVVGNGTTEGTNANANGLVLSTPSGAGGDNTTVNYTLGNRGNTFGSNSINNGGLQLPFVENVSLTYRDFSSDTALSNAVFQGTLLLPAVDTRSLQNLSVTAATGNSSANGISLAGAFNPAAANLTDERVVIGDAGTPLSRSTGSIEQVTINSAVGVSGLFANVAGGSVTTAGAGDHIISSFWNDAIDARSTGFAININGAAGTGDQTLVGSVAAAILGDGTNVGGADGITGGSGNDTIRGLSGNDALSGNGGSDSIFGANGSDIINGGDANDSIVSGSDADVANGGNGADRVFGDAGNDTLDGGAGNDFIDGGLGIDTLTGDTGADRFGYAGLAGVLADTGITIATSDVITDFRSADDDRILIAGNPGTAANYGEAASAANFAAALALANQFFSPGGGAEDYFLTGSIADGTGLLFIDTSGGSSATAVIRLNGVDESNFAFTNIIG
jgi:Ca2+-binding RTX toxin-like protein